MRPDSTPHPIPYQGSKRKLAAQILEHAPRDVETLYEPFLGSGAITLAAAARGLARRYVIGDSLGPLVEIFRAILDDPDALGAAYAAHYEQGVLDPRGAYEAIRSRYNSSPDPAALLYLLARCVKNAVRFSAEGRFNQSADHRRLGVRPAEMLRRVAAAHALLVERTETFVGDYSALLSRVTPADLVYLDPPYQGVSGSRDSRYHQSLDLNRFIADLREANRRGLRYLVSFDGRRGEQRYGLPLPAELGLRLVELYAGRSSQSTLQGREDVTVESLYLSPALAL